MQQPIKLKHLKRILDKMTPKQLEQNLLYNSERYSVSGSVEKVSKAKANLWYAADDDPAKLYTMKELKEEFDNDEIETFTLEIPKGSLVINF